VRTTTLFFFPVCSGIAKFLDACSDQKQWLPLTEITDFKKIIFSKFSFIFPNNLKSV
jgi:hypothetical protein